MGILKKIKKNKHVTRVRRYSVYLFSVACIQIMRQLSWRTMVDMGRAIGRFGFHRVRYGRQRTLDNLTRVFGNEKTEE